MKYSILEIITGILVLVIVAVIIFYSLNVQNMSADKNSYVISGNCANAEGITKGSEILISGIKIGHVEDMLLDTENYTAAIKMRLYKRIPQDSCISISGIGLFSPKYLSITAGASDVLLTSNDTVYIDQGMSIEGIIGKMISSTVEKD